MLLLTDLHNEMRSKNISTRRLADITKIDVDHLRKLEYVSHRVEPWLDEAALIARTLSVESVSQLYASGARTGLTTMGRELPTDLEVIRSGYRIPLNVAARAARRLGLADPGVFIQRPVDAEIWTWTLGHSDGCPVCAMPAGAGHREDCVGDLIYGERGSWRAPNVTTAPRPVRKGQQAGTMFAHGLKRIREELHLTQREMAAKLGSEANTVAVLERCERPLSIGMAKRFSQASGIAREKFYSKAEDRVESEDDV